MRQLVLAMTNSPTLKEIRNDRWAWARIRQHLEDECEANQRQFEFGPPAELAGHVYSSAGTPVVIDDTFAIGQWRAIDTEGNVMQEGNLLHPSADACPTGALDGSSGTVSSRRRRRV
jgi:hypothetical protein